MGNKDEGDKERAIKYPRGRDQQEVGRGSRPEYGEG